MERRLTIRMPENIYEQIRVRAAFAGSGMAEWARDLLRQEVCDHPHAHEGTCGDCGHVDPDAAVHALTNFSFPGVPEDLGLLTDG